LRWTRFEAAWPTWGVVTVLLLANSCGFGPSNDFTLSNVTVQSSHACPSGASNARYDLHATIDGHNASSSAVSIKAVSAVMTLAVVHGGWLQQVGYRYDAGSVAFAPGSVGAGSDVTLKVTVPSACTNPATPGGPLSYADYSLALTVTTSAGTFKVVSTNRHRIIAS
jgi:hypothetical protein